LEVLVGNSHVGIYTIIEEIKKEQNTVEIEVERSIRGIPAESRLSNNDKAREDRIQNIVNNKDSYNSVLDYLRGVAHNIQFQTV
jgi:hypothetical protein